MRALGWAVLGLGLGLGLGAGGCIGRSLVGESEGGEAPTGCVRPELSLCEALSDPPPPVDVSNQRFAPTSALAGACSDTVMPLDLEDGAQVSGVDLTCGQLHVTLDQDARAVLRGPHLERVSVLVSGSGHAELVLQAPRGEAIHITSAGPQLRIRIEDADLSDVRVDLDPDTAGTALHVAGGEIAGFAMRAGQLAELRVDDAVLSEGAIDVGRLTFDTAVLGGLDVVSDDGLIVDTKIRDSHLQLWSGAMHLTSLRDTHLTGCGELRLANSTVQAGYMEGCSQQPLTLESSSITSTSPESPALVVGPVVVRDGILAGVVLDGDGGQYGLSLHDSNLRDAVLCEPSLVNAEDLAVSCSVCAPDAPFSVCADGPDEIELIDSDCPPFNNLTCFGSREIMPEPAQREARAGG